MMHGQKNIKLTTLAAVAYLKTLSTRSILVWEHL